MCRASLSLASNSLPPLTLILLAGLVPAKCLQEHRTTHHIYIRHADGREGRCPLSVLEELNESAMSRCCCQKPHPRVPIPVCQQTYVRTCHSQVKS